MARCSDFQRLLLLISEDITEEQLANMKFLCDELVPKRKLKEISQATDLFRELQEKKILSEFDTTFLERLLEDVGEISLRRKLLDFKGKFAWTRQPCCSNSRVHSSLDSLCVHSVFRLLSEIVVCLFEVCRFSSIPLLCSRTLTGKLCFVFNFGFRLFGYDFPWV